MATLTPLTAQSLPALLPYGWSPLQAFWLEVSGNISGQPTAMLSPWGGLNPGESAALVEWNTNALRWEVRQIISGSGANPVTVILPGAGAFALVVPDAAPQAPTPPQLNQALSAVSAVLPPAAALSAVGGVTPASSPASLVPELVTGTAAVTISSTAGPLPSGYAFPSAVRETYRLRDERTRVSPGYEQFIIGYQRPGDALSNTLQATFPIRPLRLFTAEVLSEAVVDVDLLAPGAFQGSSDYDQRRAIDFWKPPSARRHR